MTTTTDTVGEAFNLLPAQARRITYAAYSLVGLLLSCIVAGLASVGAGWPLWLTVTMAVYPILGTGIGVVAASNTQKVTTGSGVVAVVDASTAAPLVTSTADAAEISLEEPPASAGESGSVEVAPSTVSTMSTIAGA